MELDENWYSRPDVQVVDDEDGTESWVVRASAVGGCPVGLALSALSQDEGSKFENIQPQPPDQWLQGAMDESAALEQQALDLWIDEVEKLPEVMQVLVHDHADLRCEMQLGGDVIAGTIDFSVTIVWKNRPPEDFTVEIKVVGAGLFEDMKKARDDRFTETKGLIRKYRAQCGVYRWAIGNPVMLVVCEKANGALTGKVARQHFSGEGDEPEDRFIPNREDLQGMLDVVADACADMKLGQSVACPGGGDPKCKWSDWCAVVQEFDDKEEEVYKLYLNYKRYADMAGERADEAKADLTEIVVAKGGRTVSQGGDKITWVEQHVAESTRTVKAHNRKFLKVTPSKKTKEQT